MFKCSKLFFLLIFLWVPFLNHAQDCSIDNILVEQSDCVDGFFNVFLHVQATNHGGEGFSVLGNGHDYGDFSYEPNFITIGPLEGNGTTSYEFVVIDNQFGECSNFVEIGTVDCAPPQCNIYDVVLDFQSCTSEGTIGAYNYLLNFNYTNTGFDGFDVFLGEQFLGTYAYENLPVHLVSFGPLNTDFFTLTICDNALTDCCASVEVPTPVCPPLDCGFQEVTFNFEGCHDNGGYNYILNFTPVNTTNTHFDFYLNNEFYGYYSYADLPIFLENIGPFNDNHFNIRICDNDNPDCCWDHNVETPNCGGGDCAINHVIVEAHDCNEDGFFFVDLEVVAPNHGNEGFHVNGNGNNYGNFSYELPFITLGPFAGNGETVYEFVVTDNQFPDCQNYDIIGPIDCSPEGCGFHDITMNFEGCNDNGSYNFALNFIPVNTINNYYQLFINNEFQGSYAYDNLTQFIEGVGPFEGENFHVRICDNDHPDCCTDFLVETPACNPGGCNFWDVVVEPHITDCNNDIFSVDVAFHTTNNGPLGYYIFANGDIFGPFSYALPFVTIGPFEGDGSTEYDFLILDIGNPACYTYYEFGTFECDEDVWPGDTNTDNIANHFDLLNIGIAFGSEGPQRPEATTDWNAMSAYNWTHFFEDNNNYKHADTNGDGVVNNADIAAIQQNYNLTHGEVENFTPLEGTDIDPPVYMDVPENLTTGNPFEIPVMLGTEGEPVNDIYGIAFSIELDPEIINVADLTVSFPVSWMGEPEVNTITFSRLNLETNSIDIAISRTDQNNVSGHGPIVILHGIIDDIAGIHGEMDLRATGINAIDLSQSPIPLNNPYKTSVITKLRDEDAGFISLMRDTWIHPNPASDLITIMNKQYIAVESVAVYDMSGVQFGTIQYNTNQISVSELPAGLYALKINMGGHVIMKKMVKVQR